MSTLAIHDLHRSDELDSRTMTEVRGGWFGTFLGEASSEPVATTNLMDACSKGKHIPTVEIAV